MKKIKDNNNSISLAEHAELWWAEQGNAVPDRDSKEWQSMYEKWVDFAFQEFRDLRD